MRRHYTKPRSTPLSLTEPQDEADWWANRAHNLFDKTFVKPATVATRSAARDWFQLGAADRQRN